jgi:O-antigen/teichoic acid export membrane protein
MFAIAIATATIMLAPWLEKILYHRSDEYGAQILKWCLPALIGYAFTQVYGTVMTATGSIISFCYLNFTAVLINVIMNLFLIPRYGAMGCCISALCSQFFLGISTLVFVHQKLKTDVAAPSLILYVANGLTICGILYVLMRISVNTLLLLPLVVLITFGVMWFGKMVSLNSWVNFLKKQ